MRPRTRVVAAGALAAVAALTLALVFGARQVTVVVLDVPERRATLVVKRSASLGMRLIETEQTICGRQQRGSPLVSTSLPMSFCPVALAESPAIRGGNLLLRLPFLPALHGWAGRV